MIIIVNPGEIVKVNGTTVECKLDDGRSICDKCCFNEILSVCQKMGCMASYYLRNKGVYFKQIEVLKDYTEPIDQLILN